MTFWYSIFLNFKLCFKIWPIENLIRIWIGGIWIRFSLLKVQLTTYSPVTFDKFQYYSIVLYNSINHNCHTITVWSFLHCLHWDINGRGNNTKVKYTLSNSLWKCYQCICVYPIAIGCCCPIHFNSIFTRFVQLAFAAGYTTREFSSYSIWKMEPILVIGLLCWFGSIRILYSTNIWWSFLVVHFTWLLSGIGLSVLSCTLYKCLCLFSVFLNF